MVSEESMMEKSMEWLSYGFITVCGGELAS